MDQPGIRASSPENRSVVLLNRLQNRLSDVSIPQLMRIAIEGPEPTDINFEEISDSRTDEFKMYSVFIG